MIKRALTRTFVRSAIYGVPKIKNIRLRLPFQFCSDKQAKSQIFDQIKKTMESISSKTGAGSCEQISSVYFQLGELYLKFNSEKDAFEHFEKGAEIVREQFGQKSQIHINYLMKVYTLMHKAKKIEKCIEIFLKILNLIDRTSFAYLETTNQIAALYCFIKKFDKAQEWLEKSSKIQKQLWGDRLDVQFLISSAYGKMQFERKNFSKAYNLLQNCTDLYEKRGNKQWLVQLLENIYFLLATIQLQVKKDKQLAMKTVKKSKQWINRSDMNLHEAYLNHRRFYLAAGEIQQFRNITLEEISIIKERFGRNQTYATVCKQLAQNYLQGKLIDEALKWFQQCAQIQLKLGNEKSYSSTLFGIASCKLHQSKFDEAIKNLEEYLSILSRMEENYAQRVTLKTVLGQLYAKISQRDKSISFFESALEDQKKVNRPQETYNLHHHLINLYYTKQNKVEDLRKCFNHLLQCEKIGRQILKLGEEIEENIIPIITQVSIRLKEVERAWPFLERERKHIEKLPQNNKYQEKLGRYQSKLAFYYQCVGDYKKSIQTFQKIIKTLKQQNSPPANIAFFENIMENIRKKIK